MSKEEEKQRRAAEMLKKEEEKQRRAAETLRKEVEKRRKQEEKYQKEEQRILAMKEYEQALYDKGLTLVAGVDEVGRGPLAGPVVTAAVILPVDFKVHGINDSKKLSEKKREELYDIIIENAAAYSIGMVDHMRIDEINILNATKEAMKQAISSLPQEPEHLLIDAVKLDHIAISQTAIIKGDAKSLSIAAASIVAKVTRDRMMVAFDEIFPGYDFASNKGYGTKAHYDGIYRQGICAIHRRTFLKNILREAENI